MNTNTNKSVVKTVNYTKEQEQILRDVSPLDLEGAKAIGKTMGKSYQSIIAKVKNLGLEYTSKPAPRKKAVQATKEQLVALVQKKLDRDLSGLEKATRGSILLLINGLDHVLPVPVEPELPELGDSA